MILQRSFLVSLCLHRLLSSSKEVITWHITFCIRELKDYLLTGFRCSTVLNLCQRILESSLPLLGKWSLKAYFKVLRGNKDHSPRNMVSVYGSFDMVSMGSGRSLAWALTVDVCSSCPL